MVQNVLSSFSLEPCTIGEIVCHQWTLMLFTGTNITIIRTAATFCKGHWICQKHSLTVPGRYHVAVICEHGILSIFLVIKCIVQCIFIINKIKNCFILDTVVHPYIFLTTSSSILRSCQENVAYATCFLLPNIVNELLNDLVLFMASSVFQSWLPLVCVECITGLKSQHPASLISSSRSSYFYSS